MQILCKCKSHNLSVSLSLWSRLKHLNKDVSTRNSFDLDFNASLEKKKKSMETLNYGQCMCVVLNVTILVSLGMSVYWFYHVMKNTN